MKAISMNALARPGLVITSVTHGNKAMPKCGSYGAWTLHTNHGTMVLWSSMGELNLSKAPSLER